MMTSLRAERSNLCAVGRWLLFGAIFLVGCAGASAVVRPGDEEPGGEGPQYAAGRLVVRVTPEAAERLERAVQREGDSFSAQDVPVEALRQLSERHGVVRWRRLISNPSPDDPTGLGRVYVLEAEPGTDILTAVQDFSSLTGVVEYAEPDALAEIQE